MEPWTEGDEGNVTNVIAISTPKRSTFEAPLLTYSQLSFFKYFSEKVCLNNSEILIFDYASCPGEQKNFFQVTLSNSFRHTCQIKTCFSTWMRGLKNKISEPLTQTQVCKHRRSAAENNICFWHLRGIADACCNENCFPHYRFSVY